MERRPPHLEAVLARVVRGRVAYLVLSPEQKRALRDRDGQRALDVLRHLLGARGAIGAGALPAHRAGVPGGRTPARARARAEALPPADRAAEGGAGDRGIRPVPAAVPPLRGPLGEEGRPPPARTAPSPCYAKASCRQALGCQAPTTAALVGTSALRRPLAASAARTSPRRRGADAVTGRAVLAGRSALPPIPTRSSEAPQPPKFAGVVQHTTAELVDTAQGCG